MFGVLKHRLILYYEDIIKYNILYYEEKKKRCPFTD